MIRPFLVLVIDILVICIYFEFRYLNFGFSRPPQLGETYEFLWIFHVAICNRSRVQRFRGSWFNSRPRSAFGLHIYEKSVSFVRPNPKFGAKLAITWENEYFYRRFRVFNPFYVLNPERWTLNLWTVTIKGKTDWKSEHRGQEPEAKWKKNIRGRKDKNLQDPLSKPRIISAFA